MTVYNKASLVLAESPAYKAGKIQPYYPLTPDVSFDFTRATSATRVNASGNIEKETQNLLVQSNTFDTNWTISEGTILGGQTGYDGSTNAWLYTDNVGTISKSHDVRQSVSESGVNCFSIYAKMGTKAWVKMYSGLNTCFFNIDPNYVGNRIGTDNTLGGRIEDVGNGWFRLSIFDNGSTSLVLFGIAGGDNSGNYLSDGTGTIYIQNAQLEQGLVARDYQETTTSAFYGGITDNIPRLDYTDSSCPALLLEPQRTNELQHSEYLEGWNLFINMTLTANNATSPEGLQNAYKIETTSAGAYLRDAKTLTAGNNVFSIFAKKGNAQYIWLATRFFNGFTDTYVWFDIENGTKGGRTGESFDYDIEDYGNGWYRCYIVHNVDAGDLFGYAYVGLTNTDENFAGAGGLNGYLYGGQWESGSYATSYIPTYGSAVTRNNDNVSYTQQVTDSSSFAVFIEFEPTNQSLEGGGTSIQYPSVTDSYWARLYPYYTNEKTRLLLRGTGFSDNIYSPSSHDTSTNNKWLISFDGTRLKAFANGEKLYDEVNTPYEFQSAGTGIQGMIVKSILNFNAPLTDQEAIDLTTI